MTSAQYVISLCDTAKKSNESLGIATRAGSSNPKFQFEATKVIHSILTFSPAPDTMAVEFLNQLEKVQGVSFLVKPVLDRTSQFDCSTWATQVIDYLHDNFPTSQRFEVLKPFTDLATEMLSYLLIATRNPGGKKTPQRSSRPSPDPNCFREIPHLLEEATTKRGQEELKELLFRRDGFTCPLTDLPFRHPHAPSARYVSAQTAHILPFSFHDKPLTIKALEAFAGRRLAEEVTKNINHPCNAFNVQWDARYSYNTLVWGIEAVEVGSQWKYFYRGIRPTGAAALIRLTEGQEIIFNHGPNGGIIDKPDPHYCNLKLAIARALHACGAADVIAEIYRYDYDYDDDAIVDQPSYFGGPFFFDDSLRRLEDRLLT